MKHHFTILMIFGFLSVQGQNNRQAIINTSGGSFQHGYFQFEWSVGEAALIDHMEEKSKNLVLTNGFIQPYILFPGNHYPTREFHLNEVRVFPNPAIDFVELNISTNQTGQLVLRLFNTGGQLLYSKVVQGTGVDIIERISLKRLPKGNYSIQLELLPDPGSIAKKSGYKLIKIQ